jgi:hypothetical protein
MAGLLWPSAIAITPFRVWRRQDRGIFDGKAVVPAYGVVYRTSPSLDRFPIFAAVGVSKVWHYNGECVTIFRLAGEQYRADDGSAALSPLTRDLTIHFLRREQ